MMRLQGRDSVTKLEGTFKKFLSLLVLVMMGMYFSTSVSGMSVQLGSTLMAFFATALAVLVISLYVELGKENVKQHVRESKLTQMLYSASKSDWAKAIFIGGFNVMLPTWLLLNLLKQKVKIFRGTQEVEGRFTKTGRQFVDELYKWKWASILVKICLLGELFFTLQVGVAKVTYIFLSWLNAELASVDFAVVIFIIFFIGYTMFLAPPVPGVPVYVFCGIVVADKGRKLDSIGFGLGCTIACLLAWCLKLAACTGQYMIGYLAGKYLSIQALIGVDKVPTRAIEQLLKVKGLSVGKVAVLVGGPDWPTSVTCGILKLNIPQMLLGTAPVFFVSSPCVLAGAFIARVTVGEDSIWSALANTFTGLAVAGQAAAGLVAVKSITKVVESDGDELAKPRPEHEAVARLTQEQEAMQRIYDEVTDFKVLPLWRRLVICIAAGAQLMSGFIFAMGGEYCFRPFAVSSNIKAPYEENGLDGSAFNIVKPPGWCALALFSLGVCLHIFFAKDTGRLAAKRLEDQKSGNIEAPDASMVGNRDSEDVVDVVEATDKE
jgi:membrane protein DedA with SNARE-associated domain